MLAAVKRRAPRRTRYSRSELPLGTISTRDAGNGQSVHMIKIRMDGPSGRRWIPYARWWWEQRRGTVPRGQRVCHKDGNLLNDDPKNLVLLTPGQVFNLYHQLDPQMSRRNHAACGRHASQRNTDAARARREAGIFSPTLWYPVDFSSRVILMQPRKKRWMVYDDCGVFQRLAERLKDEVQRAKAGNVAAADFVLQSADAFDQFWRWLRPLSLGYVGVNCMTASILTALADSSSGLSTQSLCDAVTQMRRRFEWNPSRLHMGVLSSIVSKSKLWIARSPDELLRLTAEGLALRIDGPRIVGIRGKHLDQPAFASFRREAAHA